MEQLELEKELFDNQVLRMNLTVGNKTGIDCNKCLNKGFLYTVKYSELFGYYEIVSSDCDCMIKRNIYHTIKQSGLENQFNEQTFENYTDTEQWQQEAKTRALEFSSSTLNDSYWFYIGGQIGSGKTHLCVAISKTFIDRGYSFKYLRYTTDFIGLQKRLKSGFPDVREKAEKELNELINVDVLYIDDFLKVRDLTNLFDLIDSRYVNKGITIISSEMLISELNNYDPAITSRITEKCNRGRFLLNIKRDNSRNQRLKKEELI